MKPSSWLDQHVEEWIKPHLGLVPEVKSIPSNCNYIDYFLPGKTGHLEILQECWENAKKNAKGDPILLAGRDTWLFEVLARIEGHPTVFLPQASSAACGHPSFKGKYKHCYGVDSGHRGSVPKTMGCERFGLVYCSGTPSIRKVHQLIPDLNVGCFNENIGAALKKRGETCYNLYCWLEGHPKYWYPGKCETPTGEDCNSSHADAKVVQYIDCNGHRPTKWSSSFTNNNFEYCAQLTMHIAQIVGQIKVMKYFILKPTKQAKAMFP